MDFLIYVLPNKLAFFHLVFVDGNHELSFVAGANDEDDNDDDGLLVELNHVKHDFYERVS